MENKDIEELALKEFPKADMSNVTNGTDISSENRLGFIAGYKAKAAQQEKMYSEEDLRIAMNISCNEAFTIQEVEDYIQLLNQRPKEQEGSSQPTP